MRSPYAPELRKLLAIEYNCSVRDFDRTENVITVSRLQPGRRAYAPEKYFFSMVTLGGNAVITADESLNPFLREFVKDRVGHWLFEIPNLLPLEKELNRFSYTLSQTHHMFLPGAAVEPAAKYPVKWFYNEDIRQFYGDSRFSNAILPEYDPARPDRSVVCVYDGEKVMGMAGCSEDAPGWFQIGIDVVPEYRSKGIGTYLVTLLRNQIEAQGGIPFYGTSVSNYHSWNIAINSGFLPAWVEINAVKII